MAEAPASVPKPKIAVQFGAGNIGRGFLGQLYFEAGYATIFVDVSSELVAALNAARQYRIEVVDAEPRSISVANVTALAASDVGSVAAAILQADIVGTSVGAGNLAAVAPSLASGIALRLAQADASPLNVIVCENKLGAAAYMRAGVARHLDASLAGPFDAKIGFVDASIGRMVPVVSANQRKQDPLTVFVEAYCELPVDAAAFRGAIPNIPHLLPKSGFAEYVERKLFLHNAGHAAAAYLGYLRHHEFVWQAMADPLVRPVVDRAMQEACLGLHRKHGSDLAELREHAEDLKRRFANRALGDQIARVAGDPMRKLGPEDRLAGAIKMCLAQGVAPDGLALALAGAMMYDSPDDPGAQDLIALWRKRGPEGVLEQVCGFPVGSPPARAVLSQAKYLGPFTRR